MNALDTLFQWLLAASLRASVVAAGVLALQVVLRAWLPPRWRHALWLPVVLVMVLPVLPVIPWSPLPATKAPVPVAMEPSAMPPMDAAQVPVATAPVAPPASKFTLMNALAVTWLLGACAFAVVGVAGYRKSLAGMERSAIAPEPELMAMIDGVAAEVGLKWRPWVLMSPQVESPAVTGLLRPLLLLPAGFPAGLTGSEARLVVVHELTHLKRGDLPANWLLCLLQVAHWFNPVIWFAFARLRADRETVCDAQVLSSAETDHRADYGHALLKLQSAAPPFSHGLAFVGLFKRGAGLHSRIREISRYRRTGVAWNVAAVGLVGICTLLGITRAEPPAAGAGDSAKPSAASTTPASPAQQAISNKLREIIVPVISFEDTSVQEAVEFFRLRSVDLDTKEPDVTRRGLNLIVKTKDGQQQPVIKSLKLRNVPLSTAFDYVADLTGMTYRIDDAGIVIFSPVTAGDAAAKPMAVAAPTAAAAGKAALDEKLNRIVVPIIHIEDAKLDEAIEYLRQRSAQLDPETDPAKKGVNFVIRSAPGEESPQVKPLQLRNVSLAVILKHLAEATGMEVRTDEHAVYLVPKAAGK
ncbi:M56 family metallopeptidase [Luteolibacter sp. LG18]|uniref:M56 family metallopeptidase n=1 Tax=Luteolibacter sp. LG18 TaxID=2819286 RepID=UPI002B29031D|nr:hypothetical protein llg_32020 [Luteolibacter sp. LG18]